MVFGALIFLALLQSIIQCSNGARILGIVPSPSYSHQIVFQPIWKELSLRGHQVTTVTTDPIKDPSLTNLTEIDLHYMYDDWKEIKKQFVEESKNSNNWDVFLKMYRLMTNLTDNELRNPAVQNLISNKNQKFDLVMVEYNIPIVLAFAERFECPLIALASADVFSQLHDQMGNPTNPVLYPSVGLPFIGKLNFKERLISFMFSLLNNVFYQYMKSEIQSVVYEHFGSSSSSLDDLLERIDMVFISSDPILNTVRPLVPATIQIGPGMHLQPLKPLPKDIQKFLDSGSEGVIYFSLGSNAQSKDLDENTLKILIKSLSKLPYKVLWKFEDHLSGKPDNVMITKWAPQQDILRHPNIKLFISQCGLQSTEEALHYGIPMLAMPMFGDQITNSKLIELKGLGLSIDHHTITEEEFSTKILELIQNPKYRTQIKELANLAMDQPMTGLERAVWWTEYVLRHKAAKHLRSPAVDIPTYQYYFLDIIAFCSLVTAVIVYVIFKVICLVGRLTYLFKSTKKIKTS